MPLSYIGGKSRIGKWIVDYIPRNISTYVEPFSGMYWVFFNIPLDQFTNLKNVVYNDFNPLNVNLFNCLQNNDEFQKVITLIPSQNRDLFNKFQEELFSTNFRVDPTKPDYETAYKWAYILTQVWSGTNPEKGKFIDLKGKYKSKFDTFKSKLTNDKWKNYFGTITDVENFDFGDSIQKWDSPDTFFYLDPPYYKTEDYYANHEFGIETHQRLADSIKNIQGKFALSYYYFPQLEEWFPKDKFRWVEKEFSKAAMATAGKQQTKGVELLIMNY